jgi:hypothetical protein
MLITKGSTLAVFSLGVKETAYDSSVSVSGAKFLKLPEEVELTTLTTVVDLSSYIPLKRCSLLVLHQSPGEGGLS